MNTDHVQTAIDALEFQRRHNETMLETRRVSKAFRDWLQEDTKRIDAALAAFAISFSASASEPQ